jgi:hypothetical protein
MLPKMRSNSVELHRRGRPFSLMKDKHELKIYILNISAGKTRAKLDVVVVLLR